MPGSGARSAPVAWISRRALARNVRSARALGARWFDPSGLEADAWGHGASLVHEVLGDAGLEPHGGSSAEPGAVLSADDLLGLPQSAGSPALRLTGSILSVKELRAGEGVSYGYAYRAPADTRVALVTGGYAQGIVRSLGGAVDVAIAGERHPIVGRVAMDVCVVEIRDAAARRGDEVLFLGDPGADEPSLAAWVAATGLGAAELLTTVGLRAIREEAP